MELRHLRYYVMLADTLNFTRAAQRLFITQSTLSHQIIQLEQELATPLLNRSGRAVHLTSAGQLFKSHAMLILRQAESAKTAVDELGNLKRGLLNIGTVHSFNHSVLLPVVSRFMQMYPAVRVTIEETSTSRIEAGLVDGTFDFGATVAPVQSSELEMEVLLKEDYVVVVRKMHPLANRKRIRFSDLSNVPLAMLTPSFATRRIVDLSFEVSKLAPLIRFESNSIEVVLDQVNRSDLVSILPLSAIATRKGFLSVRFSGTGPNRTCGLCWLRSGHRSAAALVLADMIRASYAGDTA
jgi:LysR family transcriptional regulator, cyn operon transcriptional activator